MAFYDQRRWQTELYHSLKLVHVVESQSVRKLSHVNFQTILSITQCERSLPHHKLVLP